MNIFSKFTLGASTSKAGQNTEKGLLPTPKDKEPATEAMNEPMGAKTRVYDPSLNHIKRDRCNEMGT